MEQVQPEKASDDGVKFIKGCPICEHSDPELERDLDDLARMLFDLMLANQRKAHRADASGGVDNTP